MVAVPRCKFSTAKNFGREIKNFNEDIWSKRRFGIVEIANYQKFSQNPALKQYLLNTYDKFLVEASPVDAIWGIGLSHEDPNAKIPKNWRGLNILGFVLMSVRENLR